MLSIMYMIYMVFAAKYGRDADDAVLAVTIIADSIVVILITVVVADVLTGGC